MAENPKPPRRRIDGRSCLRAAVRAFLLVVWTALTVPLVWPLVSGQVDAPPAERTPGRKGVNYLIVTSPALSMGASAWAEYRRSTGYIPRILSVQESESSFESLRAQIQKIYFDSGSPFPFHVLLLGHAHPNSSTPEAYLPAGGLATGEYALFLSGAEAIASDTLYAVRGDDLRPLPIAIGRIPARNDGEALRVLARVQQYESAPPAGAERTHVDLIASDSGFGPQFDALVVNALEYYVTNHLPEYYEWRILYGNPESPFYLPAQEFPAAIAGRLNGGSLLVMYIGHGLMDYLGPIRTPQGEYVPAFTYEDLARVRAADRSIAALVGCMIGQYDTDGDQASLAESLLLQPGGTAAAYAASRITSPEGNAVIVKDLLNGLLQDRTATAGEWTRRAEAAFTNPAADRALWMRIGRWIIPDLHHLGESSSQSALPDIPGDAYYNLGQHAYNLFGDPAMGIAYPAADLAVWTASPWLPDYSAVEFTGRGNLPAGTEVTVSLLYPPGRGSGTGEAAGSDDWVDGQTAAAVSVSVGEDGGFRGRLELPAGTHQGRYILKAAATDAGGIHVGSRAVYLGVFTAIVVFAKLEFWWTAAVLALAWSFRAGWINRIRMLAKR